MKSIIFGAGGQDGQILAKQLESRGGTVLRITPTHPANPISVDSVNHLIREELPDRIYYLAAHHRSSEQTPDSDGAEWMKSFQVHLGGWVNVLDAVKEYCPQTRLLFASSAHVFGLPKQIPQDESTLFQPTCAYGCSKLAGMQVGRFYREQHGMHVSHAILYPHESVFRGPVFLSKKLLLAAQQAAQNPSYRIEVGDPEATCDWGYAPEYTLAMQNILELEKPEDLVVATGFEAKVAHFAEAIFACFGLDWKKHVLSKPELLKKPTRRYIGNSSQLLQKTGSHPRLHLPQLAQRLVNDLQMLA
ncbi:MAG: GDP-mannose 4,6-dehydratase [Verrucomicrobia bacterium]|nr:GDP-mannose 4,6-dehydratase [Verrucomicrobiota bacterium]